MNSIDDNFEEHTANLDSFGHVLIFITVLAVMATAIMQFIHWHAK
jgi:hypothetical protein